MVFIAITCWWLTQDRSIPVYDAGDQLETAILYHNMIAAGNLLGPLTHRSLYPVLGHIVGATAAFVGGVNVASPIIGENIVFVPLLALGCYQTGRLLFGPLAGMLAVIFVLGSPLLISLFHVFLLDAPLTALVAVSVWLILASEDFGLGRTAALAGLAVGLGFNIKSQFPLFVVGLVAIVLLHGGWRNWRGFAIFCLVAGVVGAPWYVIHFSDLGTLLAYGGSHPIGEIPGTVPPTLSTDNLLWYFWNVLNSQLLAPLFALAVAGALWTSLEVVRGYDRQGRRLELSCGRLLSLACDHAHSPSRHPLRAAAARVRLRDRHRMDRRASESGSLGADRSAPARRDGEHAWRRLRRGPRSKAGAGPTTTRR